MRNMLIRLALLLVFWFSFLDLFVGRTKGQWIWTAGVIGAFFFAEGVARLALWIYLKSGNQDRRKADGQRPGQTLGL